ncbi:transglutaminase-like domain-containing protein [Rosistilla oblonga]|uniref:Transglutaminase-like superfamily protein n=1 Tax=Rosistilla oblonga TaxID=2527990 RepID=A0A518J1R8_9BACT|nr:transglutaminase-like domain-containing protein [Rosistilla oblonga]QDV59280.1 Transglutaminase-like superfamily protein [Rosistilla oblonga]
MSTWSRRRTETIALAVLAISSVIPLRCYVESAAWFPAEMAALAIAFLVAEGVRAFCGNGIRARRSIDTATVALGVLPVVFAIVGRMIGSPIAFEMSALTTFGAVSLAMAIAARTNQTRSLSLILSGFLVLFSASISDSDYAVALPLLWMLACVWHLIANHWERLDLAMPDSVQRTWSLRPKIMIVTLLVLAVGAYLVKDSSAGLQRLTLGLMPTSGGSEWSDPAARGGVGTGDAAIAAKDHAESFGAVDSDIMLESTESSLFDMFNDMIGEPKEKNKKQERAQAMGPDNFIQSHERNAKSEQGGGTFSTDRLPPKKHHHFKDAKDASVVQWDGPTGIRLAMHRYDTFDGRDWSQTADLKNEKLTPVVIDEATWFFDPVLRGVLSRDPDSASVGLLKVIRLDSLRLPVPMLTAGIHIKEIDRQDFFALSEDGCFFMPGRERVPPLTVVHVASLGLMEDEIRDGLEMREPPAAVVPEIDPLVKKIVGDETDTYEKLQSIVSHLRSEFSYDRDGESTATSLSDFLQSRRGGDHLFATTAALMARQIGMQTRLVTGFYVRPDAFDISAGHSSVLPQDVHVWAEVQLEDGRWFEIEPTPGFQQPHYRPSWRLVAQQFAATYWTTFVGGTLALLIGYVSRSYWGDWLLTVIWTFGRWLRPRHRIRLAIGIIEARARLAGKRRPVGRSQRAWLEQLTRTDATIAHATEKFFDAADRLFFGHGNEPTDHDATGLVDLLHVHTITALSKEATS